MRKLRLDEVGVRLVLQRVASASVSVDDETVSAIGPGFLVLLGVAAGDTAADADALAVKVVGLRVFTDAAGKFNESLVDVGGEVLVVSQFTLLGDVRRGRRPSFSGAAAPEVAAPLVERFVDMIRRSGLRVVTGVFGAMMQVDLVNDGPVTIVIDASGGRVV